MEFHQLRYFVAAAELSSMSRAAEREHVTQPALSRQVALLERQLGCALFERRKQRIHLTDAGRFLLPRARQILCDAETAVQQLREQFGGARRTLRIGCIGPFLDDLVAPALRALRARTPRAAATVFELPPRAQLDRLLAGELDAAIVGNFDEALRAQVVVRPLSRHRMALVVPVGHRLAKARVVDLGDCRDERFVSLATSAFPGRRLFLEQACAAAGFVPHVAAEVDSVALMLGAVAAGDGIALAPRHARKVAHAGCVFVALAEPVPVAELLLVLPRGRRDAVLLQLAEALATQAKSLQEP